MGGSATATDATWKRKATMAQGPWRKATKLAWWPRGMPPQRPARRVAKMHAAAAGSHEINLVIGEDPAKAVAKLARVAKKTRVVRRQVWRRDLSAYPCEAFWGIFGYR